MKDNDGDYHNEVDDLRLVNNLAKQKTFDHERKL